MKTQIKLALSATVVAAVLGTSSAFAGASANIGITSNYIWRGITQNDDNPALQGGLDYDFGNGFSVGTWASMVDFDEKGTEVDFYGNYGGKIGNNDYSVGIIRYAYPSIDDADFTELNASLGVGIATLGLAYMIDSDFNQDGSLYYSLGVSKEVANGITLGGTIGHAAFDTGDDDYTHYQLTASKGDFTLALDDNNLGGADPDPRISLAWSHSFDF